MRKQRLLVADYSRNSEMEATNISLKIQPQNHLFQYQEKILIRISISSLNSMLLDKTCLSLISFLLTLYLFLNSIKLSLHISRQSVAQKETGNLEKEREL